jgi:hypothetical protein
MLDAPFCVIPAAICAHIIAAFCIGVFFFIWTPDALAKWRQTIAKLEEYSDYPLTLRLSITPRNSPIHHSDRSTSVSNHQKEKSYGSCFSEEREEGGILKHDA